MKNLRGVGGGEMRKTEEKSWSGSVWRGKGEGVDEMPREMMKGYLSAIKFHLCGKSVRSRPSRAGRERLR